MKTLNINTALIDGYARLLENLNPKDKLDLISKLSVSVKKDMDHKKTSFKKSFGAFESKKSAEEIIKDISDSRVFNRKIESF